jgi:DNA-binding NarL/FixJ family response regulator
MAKARVLIADDHEVVRQGILSLVKMLNQFEVCGEAMDGRDAVQKAKELRPDIVIIDIGMPQLNGLDATGRSCASDRRRKSLSSQCTTLNRWYVRFLRLEPAVIF